MHGGANDVYLTFDDGPHPQITPWVLDLLQQYEAKASFFCIGNNVMRYPDVYRRILDEGHAVGNHTFHHLNGWKTGVQAYIDDVAAAARIIDSACFRPPYGRLRSSQAKALKENFVNMQVIMWDVLSADFDHGISADQCLQNVLLHYEPGSIIVFHDSEKAFPHLQYVLPKVLEDIKEKKFNCKVLGNEQKRI